MKRTTEATILVSRPGKKDIRFFVETGDEVVINMGTGKPVRLGPKEALKYPVLIMLHRLNDYEKEVQT